MEGKSTFNEWNWEERYKIGATVWQCSTPHPKLVQHLNLLTNGASNLKIFVPLCGKSKDIPYLLSLGHTIFGIEFVLQAIQELQVENDIKMEFDSVTSVFSTSDGKLKIFYGDIFKCPIERFGPFDAVWDRGSFGSFDFSLRGDYVQVIKRSVSNSDGSFRNFNYVLQTYEYDRTKYGGPPAPVDKSDIEMLFLNWVDVTEIERCSLDRSRITALSPAFPDNSVWELTFLLKPRSNEHYHNVEC